MTRLPSTNRITLPFGATTSPYSAAHPHNGLDIGWETVSGTKDLTIRAPISGKITLRYNNGDDGNGAYMTDPAGNLIGMLHNFEFLVKDGDMVTEGQLIGIMGDTGKADGVHCHFCVKTPTGAFINPLSLINGGKGAGAIQGDPPMIIQDNDAYFARCDKTIKLCRGYKPGQYSREEFRKYAVGKEFQNWVEMVEDDQSADKAYAWQQGAPALIQQLADVRASLLKLEQTPPIVQVVNQCAVDLDTLPAEDAGFLVKFVNWLTRKK